MTRDPITASPDEECMAAVLKMRKIGCRHLPIVLEGTVIDTISIRDLVFDEIDHQTSEIEDLKRYIQG
jgi:predicted transcriptional regulator